jgi:hypothetical protein
MLKPKAANVHTSTEDWMRALIDELRPLYAACGLDVPVKIRGTIAFTSRGKPTAADARKPSGQWPAECWPACATDDGYCELFVRADHDDPVEIARIVAHELIHACLPQAKHGKPFRDAALRLGLEGPMRRALPGRALTARLSEIVGAIGPLPRARLNYDRVTLSGLSVADRPKTQTTRMLKADCWCGYTVRITAYWIRKRGPPPCPAHGPMKTALLELNTANDDADSTVQMAE